MPKVEEISEELMSTVDSDLDAWESFYKKYKNEYEKIDVYERKIDMLERELKDRDAGIKGRYEKEKGTLLILSGAFLLASFLFVSLISNSLNVWLYFTSGLLIGLGAFSLIYLWTR